MATKKDVLNHMEFVVQKLLWDDRKEDDDLPLGAIEEMVKAGELTVDEIVASFRKYLEAGVPK